MYIGNCCVLANTVGTPLPSIATATAWPQFVLATNTFEANYVTHTAQCE